MNKMNKKLGCGDRSVRIPSWAGRGLILFVFLFSASLAVAQLTTGTISGVVTDQSGAAIPGVTITVKKVDTGITRTTATGARGRYGAPNLPVGNYEVSASLAGFQTSIRAGIEITVGRQAVVDHTLQVGDVTQQVTVTAEASLVNTTSATVSELIGERTVKDLPLNNRDLTSLTYLQPGVLRVPTDGEQGTFSGQGNNLTVGGARQTHNIYLSDGISVGDLSGNIAGSSGASTGVETIKEFQIITNNYSAQYKSAAGAIISMVTKSGTNSFHGSAFEFFRNDDLDAANFFDNAFEAGKGAFVRNQFGGSAGGPIIPDKTFFFVSYEGQRERLGTTDEARIPTIAARQGILPDGTVEVAPEIQPFLDLYPVPGVGNTIVEDFGDGTVRVSGGRNQSTRDDFASAKINHQFANEKIGAVSGTWNFQRAERGSVGILKDTNGQGLSSQRDSVSATLTGILTPNAVNEAKFGWNITKPTGDIPITDVDFESLGLTFRPDRTLVGQIDQNDVDDIGFRTGASEFRQESFLWADTLSWIRGNHSMKMGSSTNYLLFDQNSCSRGCNGIFQFRGLENFLTGKARRFDVLLPTEVVPCPAGVQGRCGDRINHNLDQIMFGAFFQDNWQISPSFTLNLGLRYEFVTVPEDSNGATASFFSTGLFTDPAASAEPVIGPLFENATKKSFSPRVGIAWAPGDRKTSVRSGFGVFYDPPSFFHIRTALQELPPFVVSGRIEDRRSTGLVDFPNAFDTQLDLAGGRPNTRFPEFAQKNPYIMRWSLNIQRELGSNMVVSGGYTGSRGVHLWQQFIANIAQWEGFPNPVPTGEKFFPEGADLVRPDLGEVRIQSPSGNSFYHGATFEARQRLARGLQWQMSYTVSKAIDMAAGLTSGGEQLPQGQRTIFFFDKDFVRSLSSLDTRHNFVANFTYDVPGGGYTGAMGALLGGWHLNGIISLVDGHPLTPFDPNDDQEDRIGDNQGLRPNLISGGDGNRTFSQNSNQFFDATQFERSKPGFFGNVGRNSLTSPGIANFDFSVFKDFDVTEGKRFQFRAEFFNLLNRANFGTPEMDIFRGNGDRDPDAGQITRTTTTSRQIQFGLRFTF